MEVENAELILGGTASTTTVVTKSIMYYPLASFGDHHIDIAALISFVGFLAVLDGFRRIFSSKISKDKVNGNN